MAALHPETDPFHVWDDRITSYVVPKSVDKNGVETGTPSPAIGTYWHVKASEKAKKNPSPGSDPNVLICEWQHLTAEQLATLGIGEAPEQLPPPPGMPAGVPWTGRVTP
jgi:hypothetical protein